MNLPQVNTVINLAEPGCEHFDAKDASVLSQTTCWISHLPWEYHVTPGLVHRAEPKTASKSKWRDKTGRPDFYDNFKALNLGHPCLGD